MHYLDADIFCHFIEGVITFAVTFSGTHSMLSACPRINQNRHTCGKSAITIYCQQLADGFFFRIAFAPRVSHSLSFNLSLG